MWGVAYALLVAALVLRVRSPGAPLPEPARPTPDEPLALTSGHHLLLALVLLGAPVERLVVGGAGGGMRWAGVLLFVAGLVLYRLGGAALGATLSPFTSPRPGGHLVTEGIYRFLRHPMYLGQALIAVGAPFVVGSRWVLAFACLDVVVLIARAMREERLLTHAYDGYAPYAARTKRVVPHIY
jgi:protein-S-isoprenylcysteine O-methyltransferase Ste14